MGSRTELKIWTVEWLRGRKQRVCLRGTVSAWLAVLSGVPQGSVLWPLLFLIFINDLEYGVRNWKLKFADDIKIFGKTSTDRDTVRLQEDLDKSIDWAEEWQMMLNASKRKVMDSMLYTDPLGGCRPPWLQITPPYLTPIQTPSSRVHHT